MTEQSVDKPAWPMPPEEGYTVDDLLTATWRSTVRAMWCRRLTEVDRL